MNNRDSLNQVGSQTKMDHEHTPCAISLDNVAPTNEKSQLCSLVPLEFPRNPLR